MLKAQKNYILETQLWLFMMISLLTVFIGSYSVQNVRNNENSEVFK